MCLKKLEKAIQSLKRLDITKLEKARQSSKKLDKARQSSTKLDKARQSLTKLNKARKSLIKLNKAQQSLIKLDKFWKSLFSTLLFSRNNYRKVSWKKEEKHVVSCQSISIRLNNSKEKTVELFSICKNFFFFHFTKWKSLLFGRWWWFNLHTHIFSNYVIFYIFSAHWKLSHFSAFSYEICWLRL